MKNKFLILSLLFCLASLVSCSKKKADNKVVFVLDWTPNTNHTGAFVAQAKGYFADEGLSVDIIQPSEDGSAMMVAGGRAQFGVGFQDTIAPALNNDEPIPVTAVAALIQHNTSGIISLKKAGIDRPKNLENKIYATWDSPVEHATIKKIMEEDGGDFSKLKLIPSTVYDVVTALNTEIDCVWIYYAWDGVKLELSGYDTNYLDFRMIDDTFDYYTPILVANNDFLKNSPETAKKFLRAMRRGYEFAVENPKEAADILCKAAPELDKELVLASQKWISKQYKAEVEQWGYINPERWNRFYNWLNTLGLFEKKIPENLGFTNDYLN